MNGNLRAIDLTEMLSLWHFEGAELTEMINFSSRSDPLFVGMYGNQVICFVGFMPATFLSDVAYLWMYSTPAVADHKVMVGRFGRRLIAAARERYPIIVGHCFDSQDWLFSLGANIAADNFFTIG